MSTRRRTTELEKRIRQLVDEAGGQTAFCRRVWKGRDPTELKGKVGKWYNGKSGMRADEAETVAKAFHRRPAWLLFGELPERAAVTRSEASLTTDLIAYLKSEIASRKGVEEDDVAVLPGILPALAELLVPTMKLAAVRLPALNRAGWTTPHPVAWIK